MPWRHAEITSLYRSTEKMRGHVHVMPAPRTAVIAGSPALVAGILIITFGRSTSANSRLAASIVPCVSWARRGDTSSETKPSRNRAYPLANSSLELSWTTASRSHAFCTSATASVSKTLSGSVSFEFAMSSSYAAER